MRVRERYRPNMDFREKWRRKERGEIKEKEIEIEIQTVNRERDKREKGGVTKREIDIENREKNEERRKKQRRVRGRGREIKRESDRHR